MRPVDGKNVHPLKECAHSCASSGRMYFLWKNVLPLEKCASSGRICVLWSERMCVLWKNVRPLV